VKSDDVRALADRLRTEIAKAVVGQRETVDLMLTALLAGGHVLLEGPPGTAKTFLGQCLATTLDLKFGRIQFTPDLMPGDIIGTNLFNFQSSAFSLTKGPIFCELLLADEINRTPPKTQAALLEAMQERVVTIDGVAHALSPRFTVVATQNPIEQQGVYPLPEAQLDRFLFKQTLKYPSLEEERQIIASHGARHGMPDPAAMGVSAVASAEEIGEAVAAVGEIRLAEEVTNYVAALVRATRETTDLETGASPRAGAMLALAARARAAVEGRDYVIPDDVKALALPALRHRVILSPAAEIEGHTVDDTLTALTERIEAPR
jgi:MoxR-like ATPase